MKRCLAVVLGVATVGAAASVLGGPVSAATPRSVAAAQRARMVRVPDLAPSAAAGYLWSAGDPYYEYSTSGQAVTVTNPSTGVYVANFAGVGLTSPTADVTTYDTQATCAAPELVVVECFSIGAGHVPVEARFDLVITQPLTAPNGVLDYDLLVHPARSGPLTGKYQYNSAHKTNRVTHLGTGRYELTMPGPAATGTTGTVKVTPVSITPGDCELAGWHGTRTGQVIDVDCFSATGARQNRPFLVTYVRGNNLMGLNGVTSANAFANRPTTARYQPNTQYDSTDGARVTAVRLGLGAYQVIFAGSQGPGSVNGGEVQVSAVGHTDDHCYVVYWSQQHDPSAHIDCVNNLGAPADSAFTIQWVVA